MKHEDALNILGLNPDNASDDEIKKSFEKLYADTLQKKNQAPSETLKKQYNNQLQLYWEAYFSLCETLPDMFAEKDKPAVVETNTNKPTQTFNQGFLQTEVPETTETLPIKKYAFIIISSVMLALIIFFIFKLSTKIPQEVIQLQNQMVYISGGPFMMGCTPEQGNNCAANEFPQRKVTVNSFYISAFEVTREQWYAVMKSYPAKSAACELPDCPVVDVSWNEVQVFLQKLNNITNKNYRLPTEAEWEYAARGANEHKKMPYAGSNNWKDVANENNKPYRVGSLKPNEKKLYDLSGNVWEWCNDSYHQNYYKNAPSDNPQGPEGINTKVIRGGSYKTNHNTYRVSYRNGLDKNKHANDIGFRIALSYN